MDDGVSSHHLRKLAQERRQICLVHCHAAFQLGSGGIVAQPAPRLDVASAVADESEREPSLHRRQFSLAIKPLVQKYGLLVESLQFIGAETASQATTEVSRDDLSRAD